jgi:hypothetical protein
MWLLVASIESLERHWRRYERTFRAKLSRDHLKAFKSSLDVSRKEILSLDLSLVKSTLQDAGSRLDARALYIATALVATAGLTGAALAWLWGS